MNSFKKLMTHDVVPIQVTTDGAGDPSESEMDQEKGFFEYGSKQIYSTENEEITSVALLFLKANSQYDPTLKDGVNEMKWRFKDVKNDRTMQLEQWEVIDDPRTGKTHHYELHLR